MKLSPQTLLNNILRSLMCITLAFSAQAVWAQGAYRCDDNGKVTYQATPCAGGKALDGAAAPTADQKAQAAANAAQEKNEAQALARERAARERSAPKPGGAAGIDTYKTTSMQEREGIVKNKTSKKKAHHKSKATKVAKPKPPKKTKPTAGTK